ncbi:hypothetical protein [Streptomyces sp. NEAU-YJ-81]|uniref:hypothetical protein n=1 Tax=Streptomyces sp. NEAU-YJ-81 TaxID=2820288 RepID=UPI001ABBE663|nr:hypothetical protein [Streptomyces sp. NEAU-YJ-81]MBO3680173.1 hypothetical protein [Streptomyces sp. NEAU-YJ-81]
MVAGVEDVASGANGVDVQAAARRDGRGIGLRTTPRWPDPIRKTAIHGAGQGRPAAMRS